MHTRDPKRRLYGLVAGPWPPFPILQYMYVALPHVSQILQILTSQAGGVTNAFGVFC